MIDRRSLVTSAMALGASTAMGSAATLAKAAAAKPLDPRFPAGFLNLEGPILPVGVDHCVYIHIGPGIAREKAESEAA